MHTELKPVVSLLRPNWKLHIYNHVYIGYIYIYIYIHRKATEFNMKQVANALRPQSQAPASRRAWKSTRAPSSLGLGLTCGQGPKGRQRVLFGLRKEVDVPQRGSHGGWGK